MMIPVIPLLAGWGEGIKPIAYEGIMKCPNCKNYNHYFLVEVAKQASVFLVPVAKWSKKYYLMCSVCKFGSEVTESDKDEILIESVSLPDADVAGAIWDALMAFGSEDGAEVETDEAADAEADKLYAQLGEQYTPEDIGYVTEVFGEYLNDPDQPE
jgi:hypothetical protein